jgi:multidrug efflux pump subunit AcrB
MTESDLSHHVKSINALVVKLENAERKTDEYARSIGQHIVAIKTARPDDWEAVVKEQCNLGRRSAYNYMEIADGKKTVKQRRTANREAAARHRASALRNAQPSADAEAATTEVAAERDLAEELGAATGNLRAAEIKIARLEREIEDLKTENALLRGELKVLKAERAKVGAEMASA